ncbi:glycoside hydrolase family 3 N-terminal domain-containing protein [Aquimarina sp. 2201CG5-10]|uniref:glycoside hydrolase family 3 N-terminal domain-containing protein n=1 Tax=Aquimarina callyspongiae TaxID=3098150 RepID=UPI002AB4A86A|nr:glycoside hydrolase family 3 N-terminal domain-containing protein [Aquimarina sp. 2201CG5-10]MDY8138461.1 glycoside hydrolase family 3 N-terminal domain-containing protein [Aquimarina sp. 2201CG5-10]
MRHIFQKNIPLLFFILTIGIYAQEANPLVVEDSEAQKRWVDSIYNRMTLKEKVGQLFMVDIFSSKSKKETDKIKALIDEYHIGGVIFSKGGPYRQARLNNEYQELSKIPLLIGMDAEWGLSMRLDSTHAFPWNMTLGAIQDNQLIEDTGRQIAKHCKRLGVHINFAPVVDINTNPKNPIIGNRSFGEDKDNVTQKALAFMKGMQKEGVLASAKHFPGHGDTDSDSHKTLPTINFGAQRIDSIELYPYKQMIKEGLSSVMIAHLNIPSLEPRSGYPSSISENVVTNILKDSLQFNGLIFTDALNMKGASDFKDPGDIDLAALLAGNDILLISEDVPLASQKIVSAYYSGLVTEERLSHSVRKILMAKFKAGLNKYEPVKTEYLDEELNSIKNDLLHHQLVENSLTVIKNERSILPVKNLDLKKVAYVSFGDDPSDVFFEELNKYTQVDWVKANQLGEMIDQLRNYNYVIVGFHKSNASPWKDYKFKDKELVWLYEIARLNNTVLNIFSRPYAMLDLLTTTNFEGILMAYQNSEVAQQKAAQLLFGAIDAKGKLPVSLGEDFPVGTGYETRSLKRLTYGLPESVGMNSYKLNRIDSIVDIALKERMTPGLQLIVARKGKVVFNKNYGYHTYNKTRKVKASDIYDLASLTKILATLPLTMELRDKGIVSLKTTVGEMLPSFKESNKEDITIKSMLSHYARLRAWIPFYLQTLDTITSKPDKKYYQNKKSKDFNIRVTDELYFRSDMKDSLMLRIKDSELRDRLSYKYSDLPYYLMKAFIEKHYDNNLDALTRQHFYKPLGASNTGYLPLSKFDKKRITPSENDRAFRKQIVHGHVHDQGAAMFGGIGGHAGLFANANDVTKIMQMYLNGGYYGGKQYIKEETLQEFNTCYYCKNQVRRGVGFDKPQLGDVGPTCGCISKASFGHSGFTGTFTWADPEEEIIYVFLSNRTYPDSANRKLISNNIRSEIQRLIYEAIDY